MQEKILNAIEALNALMTENAISIEPRTLGKINTMKRYLLSLSERDLK